MATSRQTWALFCGTGLDVRGINLSVDEASVYIDAMKRGVDITQKLIDQGATGKPKAPPQDWQALWDRAHAAGIEAGNAHTPTPMVVQEHSNPLNDNSPVEQQWYVSEGVCGFAWITIRPGTCSFARWLTKNDKAQKAYHGGVQVWVHEFNQSMERKEKYARAFADVIGKAGIKAYAGSRMD